ncbi:MAG: hypothetical protein WBB29_11125 [Geitlerinemataceae cyanobacterium]
MIVHLQKLALAVATIAIAPFWYAVPTLAEQEEMTALERFRLCTAFPLNSRCEGYTPPVALKQRPGNEAICQVLVGSIETAGNCKIVLTDETITIFVEEGEKLALLDDKRNTREIGIAVSDVSNLRYRETSKIDIAEVLFVTWFALFRPDKFSEIEIAFTDNTHSGYSSVTVITDRELGMNLRTHVERSTGLFADIYSDEDDKPKEPEPTVVEHHNSDSTDVDKFCEDFPLNSRCEVSPER